MMPILYVLVVTTSMTQSVTPMIPGERTCNEVGKAAIQEIGKFSGKASYRCIKGEGE